MIDYARDTLEIYAKEGQKMDVGSVNDLLNMKGGLFLQIESTEPFDRVRGEAGSFESSQIAESIISTMVYAASERSLGSEIARTEISDVIIRIAPIQEVFVTDSPLEEIKLGTDVPIVTNPRISWIYPTSPIEYGWDTKEYLRKICRKSTIDPEHWRQKTILVARTRPISEESPGGGITFD